MMTMKLKLSYFYPILCIAILMSSCDKSNYIIDDVVESDPFDPSTIVVADTFRYNSTLTTPSTSGFQIVGFQADSATLELLEYDDEALWELHATNPTGDIADHIFQFKSPDFDGGTFEITYFERFTGGGPVIIWEEDDLDMQITISDFSAQSDLVTGKIEGQIINTTGQNSSLEASFFQVPML